MASRLEAARAEAVAERSAAEIDRLRDSKVGSVSLATNQPWWALQHSEVVVISFFPHKNIRCRVYWLKEVCRFARSPIIFECSTKIACPAAGCRSRANTV